MSTTTEAAAPEPTTPDEIAEAFLLNGERMKQLDAEIAKLNAQLSPLNKAREELLVRRSGLDKIGERLKRAFRDSTGRELKKHLRPSTAQAIDQAHGRLHAAMCDPANLPLDDPIVQQRLAELRDAVNAHNEFKARAAAQSGAA